MEETIDFRYTKEMSSVIPVQTESEEIDTSVKNSFYFPSDWLMKRIEHVLENQVPEKVQFPVPDPETSYGKLLAEYGLSEAVCLPG